METEKIVGKVKVRACDGYKYISIPAKDQKSLEEFVIVTPAKIREVQSE